jgi:hypothetical protein
MARDDELLRAWSAATNRPAPPWHPRAKPVVHARYAPLGGTVALAAIAVLVAVVLGVAAWRPASSPSSAASIGSPGTTAPSSSASGGAPASCAIEFSPDRLVKNQFAFDGVVISLDAQHVTFGVNEWYRGSGASPLALSHDGGVGGLSESGSGFEVGKRYLVTGTGDSVIGCGFSRAYDSCTAWAWQWAFHAIVGGSASLGGVLPSPSGVSLDQAIATARQALANQPALANQGYVHIATAGPFRDYDSASEPSSRLSNKPPLDRLVWVIDIVFAAAGDTTPGAPLSRCFSTKGTVVLDYVNGRLLGVVIS